MTEGEWLACPNPLALLSEVSATASQRKLLLFACECCRPLLPTVVPLRFTALEMFEAAERFADGLISEERFGESFVRDLPDQFYDLTKPGQHTYFALKSLGPRATATTWIAPHRSDLWESEREELTHRVYQYAGDARAMLAVGYIGGPAVADHFCEQMKEVDAELGTLFREVFGNPFRPVAFDSAWRTTDVMLLAQGIYEERAFDRMPILADALQDAGCDSDDLLNHLRDPHAAHVRGCWALDLVLGKE